MSDLHRFIVPSNGKASLTDVKTIFQIFNIQSVTNLVPKCLRLLKFARFSHNLRGAQHNLFIPQPNAEALK